MKRSEIEGRVKKAWSDAQEAIIRAPLRSFIIGVVLGVIVSQLWRVVAPLVIVLFVVAAIVWFIAESDEPVT